jgi:hypothetical protein
MRTTIKRRMTLLGTAAYLAVVAQLLLGAPLVQAMIYRR